MKKAKLAATIPVKRMVEPEEVGCVAGCFSAWLWTALASSNKVLNGRYFIASCACGKRNSGGLSSREEKNQCWAAGGVARGDIVCRLATWWRRADFQVDQLSPIPHS
jgi:hypothetical protein